MEAHPKEEEKKHNNNIDVRTPKPPQIQNPTSEEERAQKSETGEEDQDVKKKDSGE